MQVSGCDALYHLAKKHERNTDIVTAAGGSAFIERAIQLNATGDLHDPFADSRDGTDHHKEVQVGTSAEGKACVACGKTCADLGGGKKLVKCSACTIEPYYCSVECQKLCWYAHKTECKENKKRPTLKA